LKLQELNEIPAFSSAGSCKITSTIGVGDVANSQFFTPVGTNNSTVKMTINGDGKTCISSSDTPSNILPVENGGKLRVSNATTDYT
jgi:hypothetical protein